MSEKKCGSFVANPGVEPDEVVIGVPEDATLPQEDDPKYPVTRWGLDYRNNSEFWNWHRERHASDRV